MQNPLNTEFAGNIARVVAVRLNARGALAIETNARFVDERWVEGMGIAQRRPHWGNTLIALIESSPVGEACEGARQEAGAVGPAVTREHLIVRRKILIRADIECVDVGGGAPVHVEVVIKPRLRRSGKKAEQFDRVGIQSVCRNDVARKWVAYILSVSNAARGCRVKDRTQWIRTPEGIGFRTTLQRDEVGEVREAAGYLGRRRHGVSRERHGLADSRSLVIHKPESLILDNGSAGSSAKLILLERAFLLTGGIQEEVCRIYFVITQKLPCAAMDLVRAGFQRGVQHGTPGASELRAERVCLQAELPNGIDRRLHHIGRATEKIHVVRIVIDAVQHVVVLCRTRAVCRKPSVRIQPSALGLSYGCTGHQARKKSIVPAIQRQVVDCLAPNHLPDRPAFRL